MFWILKCSADDLLSLHIRIRKIQVVPVQDAGVPAEKSFRIHRMLKSAVQIRKLLIINSHQKRAVFLRVFLVFLPSLLIGLIGHPHVVKLFHPHF